MPELSDKQFAKHIARNGGCSVGFHSREPISGHGFMTALPGAESTSESGSIKKHDVRGFREQHRDLADHYAEQGHEVAHGAWGATQDISVKAPHANAARELGQKRGEIAAYALPGTPVSARGHRVKEGGDVLLHTGSLGANDVDKRYQPGALDHPEKGSFTRNEYQNKDWSRPAGTLNGQKHTYGDILKTINGNRAEQVRNNIGR